MGGSRSIDVRLAPPSRLAARPRARRGGADPVARAAEGADPHRRAERPRQVRDPAIKVQGDEAFTLAVPEPEPAHNEAQDIPLTIVFEDDHLLVVDKPAGPGRPPGGGQSRRDAGQRLAPPLRGAADRASAGSRGPASSTASTRTRRACWWSPRPMSRTKAWPGNSPRTASTAAIWRSSPACPRPPAGTVDAPLARSSANRKKIAIVGRGPRQARGDALAAARAAQRRGAGRMPARNRPHPPGARPHGVDRPRLARRSGLWRQRKNASQAVAGAWFSAAGAARGGAWLHPPGDEGPFVVRKPPFRRTCRNCSTRLVYRFSHARALTGARQREYDENIMATAERRSSRSPRPAGRPGSTAI